MKNSLLLSFLLLAMTQVHASSVSNLAVKLAWDPNPETDLVGYNVYRGTESGGPYQKLNESPVELPFFIDYGLEQPETYYYVVTAVDSDGLESRYSGEIEVAVDLPPTA